MRYVITIDVHGDGNAENALHDAAVMIRRALDGKPFEREIAYIDHTTLHVHTEPSEELAPWTERR